MNRAVGCASAFLFGTFTVACERGDPSPRDSFVSDSAGIEIVFNHSGEWAHDSPWQVASSPVVKIGVDGGPSEYELYRVQGALRLSDGRLVIANAGTFELRFYDATGTYEGSAGRRGGGPGLGGQGE